MERRGTLVRGLLACLLALAGLIALAPTSVAAVGDYGYRDGSFSGVSNPPTSDKPQSKLWYNDGSWWAVMYTPATVDWRIFRLDRSTETWVNTGVRVDDRKQTLSDVLWDGNKLYVASNWATVSTDTAPKASLANKPARLYRYSYSPTSGTYLLDTGFPATINNNSSESITIDEDTTGRIWATWTQVRGSSLSGFTNQVYVNSSPDGSAWGTPMALPTGGSSVAPDDISSVVAYGHASIGVLYSNQLDGTVYWAEHKDGDALGTWKGSVAVRGNKLSDDHINLKTVISDPQGRVYAAVKTSLDEVSGVSKSSAQINLLVYKPGTGSWTVSKFGTISDCHTRPIVMLDEENAQVHMLATAPSGTGCSYTGQPGTIYEKVASMRDLVFPAGRGTPVIRDVGSANMNNVTSTKQTVNSRTGLVVLAGNSATSTYWHADLPIAVAQAPTASFTPSATSGTSPLAVTFTDTSTGSPTSWSWDFGDGTTSTDQNPAHTFSTAGSYAVRLTATNSAGSSTSGPQTITVSAPPAPTAGFTATPVSGNVPLTVQFTDTSTGSPTSWAWSFGNGDTSTQQSPSYTFTTAGRFTVTLTATNASGASAPVSQTVTVAPQPTGNEITRAGVSTTAVTTATTGIDIEKPAGTSPGDVLVSCLTTNGAKPTATGVPAGWSPIAAVTGVSNPHVFGYYRVAGAAEPSSYHWTYNASIVSSGGIARYTGASGPDGP
ncbi:MAG: trimeric autotransporter adhesin, partial [Nocardioidaceae bacterium]|nr:trimeric autotransporter adhesin [Nocardioidaceae bacterium]